MSTSHNIKDEELVLGFAGDDADEEIEPEDDEEEEEEEEEEEPEEEGGWKDEGEIH